MARDPKWFETLDAILDEVRASLIEHFGKAEITALFGFKHDRDGFRLLEKFGANVQEPAVPTTLFPACPT